MSNNKKLLDSFFYIDSLHEFRKIFSKSDLSRLSFAVGIANGEGQITDKQEKHYLKKLSKAEKTLRLIEKIEKEALNET